MGIILSIEISTPFIEILGKQIPIYGILYMAGIFIGALLALFRAGKRNISKWDIVYASCFGAVAGILGAKILSVITSLRYIIENNIPLLDIVKNGFVFYGGIIGGFIGIFIYCKIYKLPLFDFLDIFSVSVPLGHSLGRIGCLFSGCCYGIEYNGEFSVIYNSAVDLNTPIGVKLLPVQLICSIGLVLLYVVLEVCYKKTSLAGLCTSIYLSLYALFRFIIEFFRGDSARGFLIGISTSQLISLLILMLVITYLFTRYLKERREKRKQSV